MNNFSFYNPTQLHFGKDQITKLTELITKDKKVLLLYGGGSIKKNGVYEQVTSELKNYQLVEFGGIEANPRYETLMQAVDLARKEDIDFILAVGGGSVIDGAKFVRAAIGFEGDPWDILSQRASYSHVTDMGCVLTLPATGSEMNSFAVVSRGKDKLGFGGDPRLFPKFSIVDPCYTFSLPERQVANGIVDAFVHVLEQYLTKDINTPIQDRFSEGILQTLISEGPKTLKNKNDYDTRANVVLSATMALNGLIGSGVIHDWSTHLIGHELTGLFGIDHARSLAVILPHLLREQKELKKEKLILFAKNVWSLNETDENELIETAIIKTEQFFESLGVPTKLKDYNLNEKDIDATIESLRSHIPDDIGENKDLDPEKIKKIMLQSL